MTSERGIIGPAPRWVVALGASFLLVVSLLAMPARGDTKSELAAAEARLNALVGKVAAETSTVGALQREADDIAARIDAVENRIAAVQRGIATVRQDVARTGRQIAASQGVLDRRAWVAYESGPGSSVEFLLGSTSLSDLSDRLEILDHVAQTDAQLIAQIREQRTLLQGKQNRLQSLQVTLGQTRTELATQSAAMSVKLSAAQSVLVRLDRDRRQADALVRKLKAERQREIAAARRLAELVRQAQQSHQSPSAAGRPSIAGPFALCPVDPPHAYSDDFGAPRIGHLHAGNDIFAALGTPIRAPFGGTATAVPNGLGGNAVIVTGANGYVYNAHLSAYGTLGSVSAGTVIGYVGNTGDAAGGPTHDHFEWHPNVIPSPLWVSPYGQSDLGGAIDPFPYLNAVC